MLRYRLISGSLLIATLCVLTFWDSRLTAWLMIGVLGTTSALGLREFFRMTQPIGAGGFPIVASISGLILISAAGLEALMPGNRFLEGFPAEIAAVGVLALAGFFRTFGCSDYRVGLRRLAVTAAGLLYVVFPLYCLLRIYLHGYPTRTGKALVLFLILATKFGDIGGYTLGRISNGLQKNGNHKMVPRLSPGKSWEGFVGSLIFSGAVAYWLNGLLGTWVDPEVGYLFPTWAAVTMGVILGALGLAGDLAESVLKRASEMKDSGGGIPGMGGVLDVIDSILLVAPLFWVLVRVMPVG